MRAFSWPHIKCQGDCPTAVYTLSLSTEGQSDNFLEHSCPTSKYPDKCNSPQLLQDVHYHQVAWARGNTLGWASRSTMERIPWTPTLRNKCSAMFPSLGIFENTVSPRRPIHSCVVFWALNASSCSSITSDQGDGGWTEGSPPAQGTILTVPTAHVSVSCRHAPSSSRLGTHPICLYIPSIQSNACCRAGISLWNEMLSLIFFSFYCGKAHIR